MHSSTGAGVDVIENTAQDYMAEMKNLKEENLTLQSRLEDYENRSRRSNLHIRGIPDTVIDLQSTIMMLFQQLQPAIPIERLEIDRVHRALTPKKNGWPPHKI